jgi:hypothetical protein
VRAARSGPTNKGRRCRSSAPTKAARPTTIQKKCILPAVRVLMVFTTTHIIPRTGPNKGVRSHCFAIRCLLDCLHAKTQASR